MTKPESSVSDTSFHVAFCVDDRYLKPMAATIASLVEHNPDSAFVFHALVFSMSEDNRGRVELFPEYGVPDLKIHLIDPTRFAHLASYLGSSHYSISIFSRLVIPEVLSTYAETVLYLDADILCVGSIRELINLELSGKIAAVIPDAPVTVARRVKALSLPKPEYFNAGVMLINVREWLARDVSRKTLQCLLRKDLDMRFNDQDALNLVLNGKVHYLSPRFNYLYDLIHDLNINQLHLKDWGRAALVHFAGAVKPWAKWTGHEAADLFLRALLKTPWRDIPLDQEPQNTKEMRMYSRFLFRQRRPLASFCWYLRYVKIKAKKMLSKHFSK
jgi:UDP-glucose:(glucosyl)LPS alpha-1,3-glucosyltransferase